MADERAPDSDAWVILSLDASRRKFAERWFEEKLKQVRDRPEDALAWLEEVVLRGIAATGGTIGPEHVKSTGRKAGGGKLTKGS